LLEITIKVDEQDAEELIELAKRLVQAVEILEEIQDSNQNSG
jgi:HEPN domain-containing protein